MYATNDGALPLEILHFDSDVTSASVLKKIPKHYFDFLQNIIGAYIYGMIYGEGDEINSSTLDKHII